jgi:hypothetical protein
MRLIRGKFGRSGAFALATLLLASATPVDARNSRVAKPARSAGEAPGFGAFTPAAADPRIAAAFARSGLGTKNFSEGAFRFTPSGKASSKRAITVAVRARTLNRTEAGHALALASSGLAPSALNLGASIGWKRFALSGDVAKVDGGLLPNGRESADIGVSFSGSRWATKLDLAGERSSGERPAMVGLDQSWSVGLGGSYALTRKIDLTGGVRYKLQREQLLSQLDDKRDGQAVYFGTTFRF